MFKIKFNDIFLTGEFLTRQQAMEIAQILAENSKIKFNIEDKFTIKFENNDVLKIERVSFVERKKVLRQKRVEISEKLC